MFLQALAFFTIGIASTLGTDDLLAAFAAGRVFASLVIFFSTLETGNAISWSGDFNIHTEDEIFASVLDLVLNCACFVYIGAWVPFESFNNPVLGIEPWRLVVLFLAVLFLRRIPCILLLYKWIPEIKSWKEALFTGHFGKSCKTPLYTSDFVGPVRV
jgi:NhaP-type Na+/H+ or K+/H+ antiporter